MERNLKQDWLIEDALQSEPLAPMPHNITAQVMARIQAAPAKRPALFTWSDAAVSVVILSCLAALWFAWQHLPPILLAKLRIQGILLYQAWLVHAREILPAVLFSLAGVLAVLVIPTLYKMTMDHRR